MSVHRKAQVRDAELDMLAAMNAADAKAVLRHLHPACKSFWPGGQELYDWSHSRADIEDTFDSGFRFELQYQELEVEVYGNAAVSMGYLVGMVFAPDGMASSVNWRTSIVRVRQDGMWKAVHWHESPLLAEI